ncbi:unnamed protein product [Sphagnum troendelagicum]|uniref:ornithine carbamoyltransferase n=1 Tax=Sphagnum troendelagicum TaxID=128251 RepID=A0ABP0V3U3_9BRYO
MQATVVCFGSKQFQYQYYSRGMELGSSVSGSRLRVQSLLPQQSKDNTLTLSAFCCCLQTVYNLRSHCSCTCEGGAQEWGKKLPAIVRVVNAHDIHDTIHDLLDLALYAKAPVINGLTDYNLPCHIMADVLTIIEHLGHIEGIKFEPDTATVERARNEAVSQIEISNNPVETVKGAHVVYVDVLASSGRKKNLPCIHSTSRDFRSLLHDMPVLLKSLEAL